MFNTCPFISTWYHTLFPVLSSIPLRRDSKGEASYTLIKAWTAAPPDHSLKTTIRWDRYSGLRSPNSHQTVAFLHIYLGDLSRLQLMATFTVSLPLGLLSSHAWNFSLWLRSPKVTVAFLHAWAWEEERTRDALDMQTAVKDYCIFIHKKTMDYVKKEGKERS